MLVISIIVQIVLGILFTILAILSLVGTTKSKEKFQGLKVPVWFRYLTGLVQLTAGITMLVGIWNSNIAAFGGLWLAVTMSMGIIMRLRIGDTILAITPAVMIGALSIAVFVVNIS